MFLPALRPENDGIKYHGFSRMKAARPIVSAERVGAEVKVALVNDGPFSASSESDALPMKAR